MTATDIQEVLRFFDGVKRCNENQYMARCPCHNDKKQSLSIGRGQKGVVLKCQAGCDTRDIIARVGLKPRDLFYDSQEKPKEKRQIVATYDYPGGVQKIRYSDKSFSWRQPDGKGGWIYSRKGIKPSLYISGELSDGIAVVEGEKDADNLHRLGWDAVSGADGAGPGKWKPEYTEQLKGLSVCIFQDNDDVGKAYAQETAAALHNVCKSVYLFNLSKVWPDIPLHGDVSDLVEKFGDEKACEMIAQLATSTPEWEPAPPEEDPFLSCFKTLDTFDEEEATWLVPGWIPEGQITLMAADGGIGKTTLWCNLIAAISSGRRCILDPPDHTRVAQKVAFLTTEDSVRKKLKKKLRLAGANMSNVITPDFLADKDGVLRGLKFGTNEMERFIKHFRPSLCVFDPVQGFVPPDISCSLQVYPSPGSSVNTARISSLACSAFFTLRNQLCRSVSNIWRVIVISITSLSGNFTHASQAVSFPHGYLAINQNLIGIVDDAVHNTVPCFAVEGIAMIFRPPFDILAPRTKST